MYLFALILERGLLLLIQTLANLYHNLPLFVVLHMVYYYSILSNMCKEKKNEKKLTFINERKMKLLN